MSDTNAKVSGKESNVRWSILRENLRKRGKKNSDQKKLTRRPTGGFGLIQVTPVGGEEGTEWELNQYHLNEATSLTLRQRREDAFVLDDFRVSNQHRIDNTGVVCLWPAEEVMTYYCSTNKHLFAGKRVLELGAGLGLAGMAVAAVGGASEVIITDGNPTAVQVLRENITRNKDCFANTRVRAEVLHWGEYNSSSGHFGQFDIIIAADCTFFTDFHSDLADTLAGCLASEERCCALLLSPARHRTLTDFAAIARQSGDLETKLSEKYDEKVWNRHADLMKHRGTQNMGWAEYQLETCFPLMLEIRKIQRGSINWPMVLGMALAVGFIVSSQYRS